MPYKDPEVQRLYDKQKYQRNREKILQRSKEYAEAHKEEIAEYQKQYAEEHRDDLNAYIREWRKSKQTLESKEKQRKTERKWYSQNIKKAMARYRRHISRHRQKYIARYLLAAAIQSGRIVKPKTCSECGAGGRIHGHHADYLKPLEVVWLCHGCHLKAHNGRFGNS